MEQCSMSNNLNEDISKTTHKLFEEHVRKKPNNLALICKNEMLTYGELNEKSNQVARLLIEKNVKPNSVVGLMCERSFEMIIGLLAILKAGAAYLPIDPYYPKDRVEYMLNDSNTNIVLTQTHLKDKICFKEDYMYLDDKEIYNRPCYNIEVVNKPDDLAYVIYTSGSTGMPKGVMIENRSVINFINGVKERIDFSPNKTILALTTVCFDIFFLETLLPLTQGMTIVIANDKEQNNPRLLTNLIQAHNIDMIQMTPSRFQLLINYENNLGCLKNISEIMIGGESFSKTLLEKIKEVTSAKIYNMYGPTETTIWSSIKDLTKTNEITIGTPILKTKFYIIDNKNKILSTGEEGELCICGDGVARGYLNKEELNKERFIYNPISPGELIYKTGDLAKALSSGEFQYIGRIDNQIKLRGFRIELDEIQHHLMKIDYIKEAVVIVKENKEGKYLCAYIIADKSINDIEVKKYLLKILPDYMIPSIFVQIDNLPVTPNGKIDRNAFPEPEIFFSENLERESILEDTSQDNLIENKIRKVLSENLSIEGYTEEITLYGEFIRYGIDSVTYIKLVVDIEAMFDIEFDEEYLNPKKIRCLKDLIDYVKSKV